MNDILSQLMGLNTMEQAISSHLFSLLNTRQGSLLHMVDYGLPELGTQGIAFYNNKRFIAAVKRLIEQYEPRICNVDVIEVRTERFNCIIELKLIATIDTMGRMSFQAFLLSDGMLELHRDKYEQDY